MINKNYIKLKLYEAYLTLKWTFKERNTKNLPEQIIDSKKLNTLYKQTYP